MATPYQRNLCPRGHEIYYFGRAFPGHHFYILRLPALCPGVQKKILKEIMHIYYMAKMATPYHKNPGQRSHENYISSVEPFLVINSIYLVYLLYAQEYRRRFLKK